PPPTAAPPARTTSTSGITAWNDRLQSTDVNGIERKVRSRGCVDSGSELSLVFNTGSLHSTAEINDGLSLRDAAEIICKSDQCLKPAIGVENVVFRFIRSEACGGVGCISCIGIPVGRRPIYP